MNFRNAKTAAAALLLFALLFSAVPAAADGSSVRWRSWDAALREASKKNRLVMVVLHASWCPPCRIMERTTWRDRAVVALTESAVVPVQFDVDADQTPIPCGGRLLPPGVCASAYWRTAGLPAFVLLDGTGEYVHQEAGLFAPETMAEFLKTVEKETPALLEELKAWKDSVAAAEAGR